MINQQLKIAFSISILVAIFATCKPSSEKDLMKRLELTAIPSGRGTFLDSIPIINMVATVHNPTEETVEFMTMTCSYEDFFITNSPKYKVRPRWDCFSNVEIFFPLPPKSSIDMYIMISPTERTNTLDTSTIKIGMYLLMPDTASGIRATHSMYENRQKAKVLWSNDVDLKRLYRDAY